MKTIVSVACITVLLSSGIDSVSGGEESKREAAESEKEAWHQMVPRGLSQHPAFQFVEDDPELPRVLLIGDSISIGYTAPVRRLLEGKANVHRVPENAGDTSKGLTNLVMWLGDRPWDVIHFNWGLHDLKRMKDGKLDVAGEQVSSPEAYGRNLEKLVARLAETKAKLIWASTTPVPDGAAGRARGDDAKYNEVAAEVMRRHRIPINDLYSFAMPRLAEIQLPQNVHFTDQGSEALAGQVAAAILGTLQGEEPTADE